MIIRVRQQPEEKSPVGLRLPHVCLQQDYSHGSQEHLTHGLLLLLSGHWEEAQVVFSFEVTVSKQGI